MKQIVFVHGRAQENKDAVALKKEWVAAFREGLAKNQLQLPIPEDAIRFPYYGQTLYDLLTDVPPDQVASVIVKGIVKGDNADDDERAFVRAVIQEVKRKAAISDAKLAEITGQDIVSKGPLNWEWLQGVLKAVDRYVPFASGTSIALATYDVYQYLSNIGIQDEIDMGVRQAIQSDVPTVVVGHSLGTVVSYNLLRREGKANRWMVPLYITLGSPLAIIEIKKRLSPNKHPECVGKWFNAMDERDVVALYPLDADRFPINPSIENKRDVQNHTENRHGIAGYLNDKDVAKRIYDALVG
jgi:hypothetical protein